MFDFGLGSTELIVLAAVALIVIGPKDLPKVLRTLGQVVTKVRSLAREFQGHIEDAARDSGIDDLKKDISKATNLSAADTLDEITRTPGKIDKAKSKTNDAPVKDAAKKPPTKPQQDAKQTAKSA